MLTVATAGDHVVIGNTDQTVALFDMTQGLRRVALLTGHNGSVTSVAATSSTVLSADEEGNIRLWQLDPRAVADRICRDGDENAIRYRWERTLAVELPYASPCS